jgi:hypothetical protein
MCKIIKRAENVDIYVATNHEFTHNFKMAITFMLHLFFDQFA